MQPRRFRRVPFEADVVLVTETQTWRCELLDIALKGALLQCDEPLSLPPDTTCDLRIALPGTDILLTFRALMVHQEEDRFGFKFISEDLATLTHLRKLIELNTGDTETTLSEIDAWLED